MRWFKPSLRNSFWGLLGQTPVPSESVLEDGTEDIRAAMLSLLGETGARQFPHVARRIRFASDIQALWYLRGDVMAALAAAQGEAAARQRIAQVTDMFDGLLPRGQASRHSPLTG